jgi:hypothetical protein
MENSRRLLNQIRLLLMLFIVGLVLSGLTAFPLESELRWLARMTGADHPGGWTYGTDLGAWIVKVRDAYIETNHRYPFLAYGTDWLAFGHLMIALAFVGPLKDPVRNVWVVQFGMLACILVIPLALIAGPLRTIPLYWRGIDCCFGIFGIIPLYLAYRKIMRLERMQV